MRLSALFTRLIVFVAAGFLSVAAAQTTVAVVEERSVLSVQETLVDQGYEWATVLGDGLQVILEGEAPTEAVRFRAISAAGGMVDASRVIDNLSVTDSEIITPPEFAIEILRNNAGVSLIGLIPATTDREALATRITDIADGLPVNDLLEVVFFFKQKTAYEIVSRDWSSDVCSSDLWCKTLAMPSTCPSLFSKTSSPSQSPALPNHCSGGDEHY